MSSEDASPQADRNSGATPQASSAPAQRHSPPPVIPEKIDSLIVAVHGIGDQFRFATIQGVAQRVAELSGEPRLFSLGSFHLPFAKDGEVAVGAVPFVTKNDIFRNVGFAEVFWANIHQEAQKTQDTIEESKAWVKTIVDRMRSFTGTGADGRSIEFANQRSVDYVKLSAVLDEIIETLRTLDNLCFLAEKAGLFKFSLRDLLDDYAGAVQLVAEFKDYGGRIFERFASTMRALSESHPETPIYIVAHSEGTVVTFHSLLKALLRKDPKLDKWVRQVRGLMTIGSPIDKHVVLWPGLWDEFADGGCNGIHGNHHQPIIWWNYYDYGDPVGFQLDSTRQWLVDHHWVKVPGGGAPDLPPSDPPFSWGASKASKKTPTSTLSPAHQQPFFYFPPEQDLGFGRYLFPGKAHNDYWGDMELFAHFFGQFFKENEAGDEGKPVGNPLPVTHPPDSGKEWNHRNKPLNSAACWTLPYVLAFVVLTAGLIILDRGCQPFLPEAPTDLTWFRNLLGVSLLLAGVTATSRIPRLTKRDAWYLFAIIPLVLGAYVYCGTSLVQPEFRERLDDWLDLYSTMGITQFPGLFTLIVALVVAAVSAVVSYLKPSWGMKPLIIMCGAATAAVIFNIWHHHEVIHKTLPKDASAWALLGSFAAFIYLWWLAALIFDLTFIWHRYIRMNPTTEILKYVRRSRKTRQAAH